MAQANSPHGRHHGERKARRERTRLGSYFVACPRPKEARRTQMAPRTSRRHRRIRLRGQADDTEGSERNCTRLRDADNFADKQTTQTAARGISTRLRVATVERSQPQGQRTQLVRLTNRGELARANSQHGRHHGGRKARRKRTRLGSYFNVHSNAFMCISCSPYAFHVHFMCLSCAFMCLSCAFHVNFMCLSCTFHVPFM